MRVPKGALLAAVLLAGCKVDLEGLGSDDPQDATLDDAADADAFVPPPDTDTSADSAPPSDADAADAIVLEAGGDGDAGDATVFVRDGMYPPVASLKGILGSVSAAQLASAHVGRALLGVVWSTWEPAKKPPPCAATEVEYDGHCFVVDPTLDAAVKAYTDAGIVVSVIVVGAPPWANATRIATCKTAAAPLYCVPDDPDDFARFVGMLAHRYGDKHPASEDHGRISDWIVWSYGTWQHTFDVGAPPTGTTLRDYWLSTYVTLFTKAYDAITSTGDEMRVYPLMYPITTADDFTTSPNRLSVYSVLSALVANDATRAWRVALYPTGVTPNFGPGDPPGTLDFGNFGQFTGWLDGNTGAVASRRRVYLFEALFDAAPKEVETSTGLTGAAAQADAICRAHREAIATPNVDALVYYEWADAASEVAAGVYYGLHAQDGTPRASWTKWSTMDTTALDCGFEALPYVILHRRANAAGKHWTTTRMAASGFVDQTTWKVLRDAAPQTHEIFDCATTDGSKRFVSFDPACEGGVSYGSMGRTYDATAPGRVEIFRCDAPMGDSIVTTQAGCEAGYTLVGTLGFVVSP